MGLSSGDIETDGKNGWATTIHQRTFGGPAQCSGVGLHSGADVSMCLRPGRADSGIVFRRMDIDSDDPFVPATWDRVVNTRMCTRLGNVGGVTVGTVEHLMAALAGCGIDNAVIEIDGPEVPIMDGSAAPFVHLIEAAGIVEQDRPRRVIRIDKPVRIEDGNRVATLMPGDGFRVSFEIDFDNPLVARQAVTLGLVNGTFKSELAGARTFGFIEEMEALWAAGFAKGGSLDNAIVVSGNRVLNEGGLRFDDEFVRHKALDAVGDLYLAGAPIIGHYHGLRSGHTTNNQLLRALFADTDAWSYESLDRGDDAQSVGSGAAATKGPDMPVAATA